MSLPAPAALRLRAALWAALLIWAAACGPEEPTSPDPPPVAGAAQLPEGPELRTAVRAALVEFAQKPHFDFPEGALDEFPAELRVFVGGRAPDGDPLTYLSARLWAAGDRQISDLVTRLDALGPAVPGALLDVLEESRGDAEPRLNPMGNWRDDETDEALAIFLRDRATPALDTRLATMVADRELGDAWRRTAAIALCREGNEAAFELLLPVVLDQAESESLRSAILYRLVRIARPAPAELRDLLYVPFCGRVDFVAAATLALLGDPEAPSLILDGMRNRTGPPSMDRQAHLALAAAAVAGDGGPAVGEACQAVLALADPQPVEEEVAEGSGREIEAIERLATAFEGFLDGRPDLLDTKFERRRAAFLVSNDRDRWLRIRTIDDVLAIPEAELDLAAAALALEPRPRAANALARLDRVTQLVRRELEGADTPEERLDVFVRRVVRQPSQVFGGFVHALPPGATEETLVANVDQDLSYALLLAPNLCLSRSLLVVAVADRLDLPVRAVASPGHVFVRWESGPLRRNIECTDFGKAFPDRHYLALTPENTAPEAALAGARFLRSLGKRELLAVTLANRAHGLVARGSYDAGVDVAEDALRLDPDCVGAHKVIAWGASAFDPPATERVVGAVAAIGDAHLSAHETKLVAESLARVGRFDLARQLCERFLTEVPGNVVVQSALGAPER